MSHAPFYGKVINRSQQRLLVNEVLSKYKTEIADERLLEAVFNELTHLKFEGKLMMPFKLMLKRDPNHLFPPYIEVMLDSKV